MLLRYAKYTMLKSFHAFLEKQEKPASVLGIKEDIVSGIAAKNNMIAGDGEMESCFAYHSL